MKSGSGATLRDVDDREYVDYVLSWGPLILGHAYPAVVKAISSAAARGSSFGAPTDAESDLAELIISMLPSIDRIRFVSSGTEATMSAARLARGFTHRPEDREVRRMLSRARRFVPDSGGVGRPHHRRPEFAGNYRRHGARYDRAALQRRRGGREGVRSQHGRDRGGRRRALRRKHGARPGAARLPAALARALHGTSRIARLR